MYVKENAAAHLLFIEEKIAERIKTINSKIDEGAREVESMHDYYWENYTEMDEYGYENFDNQQALLTQINANSEQLKEKSRLRMMQDSPYFGRIDFRYEEEEDPETFYIGIATFSEKKGGLPLIYDWRSPVSSLFYDYDKGPTSYEAPGGLFGGEICSKWQYKIREGQLIYAFESDVKIDDEVLSEALGAQSDTALKNIIQTIQKEQNAIIRNTKDRILVIQGVAGSGKTSVALHRIAYLLYHDRENLKSSNVLVLSPNNVFAEYISHILPELGEEHIKEMSFDTFAYKELKHAVFDCEDRYDHMERLLRGEDEELYEEKQSEEFLEQIRGFCLMQEDELIDFKNVKIRSWEMPAAKIQELFYMKYTDYPMFFRMEMIRDRIRDEYETLTNRTLSEEEEEQLKLDTDSMFETTDLYELYSRFLEEEGYDPLPDVPYEKRILKYEDVYPMLFMKNLLWKHRDHKQIRHLVIDEMQDYTFVQYSILKQLFDCQMTILGDKHQTLDAKTVDVRTFLPHVFGKKIRMLELNRSYRNTVEIAQYAIEKAQGSITSSDHTLKSDTASDADAQDRKMELFERHGDAVKEIRITDPEHLAERILEEYEHAHKQGDTTAVLTATIAEAKAIYTMLKERLEEKDVDVKRKLMLMDKTSSHFCRGITVSTFYLAKGLEFDQVHYITMDETHPLEKQARYISATRAMHRLFVYLP